MSSVVDESGEHESPTPPGMVSGGVAGARRQRFWLLEPVVSLR